MKNSPPTQVFEPAWSGIVFSVTEGCVVLSRPGNRGVRRIDRIPAGLLSGPDTPGLLLDECAQRFQSNNGRQGTVIVPHVPGRHGIVGRPPTHTHAQELAEMIELARHAGWHTTPSALKYARGWVTFFKSGHPNIHLGILDGMDPDESPLFPVDGSYSAEEIGRQLAEYAGAVGCTYRITPGISGLALLRQHYATRPLPKGVPERHREYPGWRWHLFAESKVPPIETPGDLVWERKPTAAELKRTPFMHGFDTNAAYLASAINAEFGWNPPEPEGAQPFDPSRPGVWQIVDARRYLGALSTDKLKGMPPVLNGTRIARNGTAWLSTHGMTYLQQLTGTLPEVIDSWTSARQARVLQPWAARIRDGLAMHGRRQGHPDDCGCPPDRLRTTLKLTYAGAIGMMDSSTSGVYRPDWAWGIKDLSRFNLLRKISSVPRVPVRINKDAVYYLDDREDPRYLADLVGVVAGGAIGKFKIDSTTTYAGWLADQKAAAAARNRRRNKARETADVKI